MTDDNLIAAILTAALWNTRSKQHFEDWREVIKDYYRIRKQLAADASEPSPQMGEDVANRLKELGKMLDVDTQDIK